MEIKTGALYAPYSVVYVPTEQMCGHCINKRWRVRLKTWLAIRVVLQHCALCKKLYERPSPHQVMGEQ